MHLNNTALDLGLGSDQVFHRKLSACIVRQLVDEGMQLQGRCYSETRKRRGEVSKQTVSRLLTHFPPNEII